MACASYEDEGYQLCNDYLFVNMWKTLEEAVDYCEYNSYELAKIKNKSSYVDDEKLKEYLLKAKINIIELV